MKVLKATRCEKCQKLIEVKDAQTGFTEDEREVTLCKICFPEFQDQKAYVESFGLHRNYEDWMASRGATICDYMEVPSRER